MSGRGLVPTGRRTPPARTPRRRAGPTVPGRPLEHRYVDFDKWFALGNALSAHYAALVVCVEGFAAEDREPPPGVKAEAWIWSEIPEVRRKRRRALFDAAQGLLLKFTAGELEAAVREFEAGWRWFECDDFYEGPSDRRTVGVAFAARMVATLIGAFPNGAPASPEVFSGLMIEEMIAAESTASRIECAIRTLIRTRVFLPAIAEALAAIRAADIPEWGSGAFEVDDGEPMILWARRALEKAVIAAKAPRLPPPEAPL
jgi:hypothetical protein